MERRVMGNEYRTTIVCVDAYDGDVLQGRLVNPAIEGGISFHSLMEFFRKMEDLLNQTQLPQSFNEIRSFRKPETAPGTGCPVQQTSNTGKLATFAVRVLFRQNASWQGMMTWLEEGREEGFRSALELALLMDSALRGETAGPLQQNDQSKMSEMN